MRENLDRGVSSLALPCGHNWGDIIVTYETKVVVRCWEDERVFEYPYSEGSDGAIEFGDPTEVEVAFVSKGGSEEGTSEPAEPMAYECRDCNTVAESAGVSPTCPECGNAMEKVAYKCECIDCGHKMESNSHCKDISCPECGGTMRREDRPGTGQPTSNSDEAKASQDTDGPVAESAQGSGTVLVESYDPSFMQITEDWDGTDTGTMKVEGVCGKLNEKTANNRVYPFAVWPSNRELLPEKIASGKLLGEADHPSDGRSRIESTCVKFTELFLRDTDGNVVEGDTNEPIEICYRAEIMPTTSGKDLMVLIRNNCGVEWSSRGYGTAVLGEWNGEEDVRIVQDDFVYEAFDAVIGAATTGTGVAHYEQDMKHTKEDLQMEDKDKKVEEDGTTVPAEDATSEQDESSGDAPPVTKPVTESAQPTGMSDEDRQTLAESKVLLAERHAETLVAGLEGPAAQIMAKHLAGATSKREVQERYDALAVTLKDLGDALPSAGDSQRGKMESVGYHIERDHNEDLMVLEGVDEPFERPDTPEGVIRALAERLPGSINKPGSLAHNMWVMGWNYLGEKQPDGSIRRNPDTARYIESMTKTGYKRWVETTTTSDTAAGNPFVFAIIYGTLPKLISTELCANQPMDRPVGTVFYAEARRDPAGTSVADSQYLDTDYANHTENTAKAQLKLYMGSATVTAEESALESRWTHQEQQDLMAYHGIDTGQMLMAQSSSEIAREINLKLVEHMRLAAANNYNYGTNIPTANWGDSGKEAWDQYLKQYVLRARAKIREKKLTPSNWVAGDAIATSRIMALKGFAVNAEASQDVGTFGWVREGNLASLGNIYTIDWMTQNTLLFGYKVDDWSNVGAIFAPYLLAYVTPQAYNTSVNRYSQAMGSRYAIHVPADYSASDAGSGGSSAFCTVTIQPGTAGTVLDA